jgi:hypothetical protein
MKHSQITVIALVCLLFSWCIAAPTAFGQGKCSLQMMAGTYAMYERGSSLLVDWNPPGYFPFFTGAMAPSVNVVNITFNHKGVGKGYFWMWAGGVGATLDAIPVEVTITELNEVNCTGKFTYTVTLPGGPTATIEERFISLNNGQEMRTVPTSVQNGIPGIVWTGTSHRITKGKARSCGPRTAHGSYVTSCENIITQDAHTAIADTLLIREDVSMSGDRTGTLYESLGGFSVDGIPAWGTVTVNPDCSFTSTINFQASFGQIGPIDSRGVYFNQGEEFYSLAIYDESVPPDQQYIKYSFCQGTRVKQ